MELLQVPPRQVSFHEQSKEVRIVFVGDIQWNGKRSNSTALGALKDTLAKGMNDGAYFVGMGDYTDFMSPSNRQRMKAAALYDNAEDAIDDKALDLVSELYELALKPTKGRWLGMVEGHHLAELRSGETTDMRLCEMLGTTFLGTCGVIHLTLMTRERCETPVTIWVHHGQGNGQTGYYPLARLEKVYADQEGIDVFAIGHTTKMGAIPKNRIGYVWRRGGEAYHRKCYLVGTGGYSRSYIEGARQGKVPRGGYAERGMMSPAVIGSPTLIIRQTRHRQERGDRLGVDLRVEV